MGRYGNEGILLDLKAEKQVWDSSKSKWFDLIWFGFNSRT